MSEEQPRKYTRLEPSTWASIRAEWEIGDVTLAELSERHDVAPRTLQVHFQQHDCIKGSKAVALATEVKRRVYDEQLSDPDLLASRARSIREDTFSCATLIEDLLSAQIELAVQNPASAIKIGQTVKMLSLAAATLERTHAIKLRATGLDRAGSLTGELPILVLSDVTEDQIKRIQSGDEFNDDDIVDEMPTDYA